MNYDSEFPKTMFNNLHHIETISAKKQCKFIVADRNWYMHIFLQNW